LKPDKDNIDIDPEIREKLREVKERQEQDIQEKYVTGEIVDYRSKRIKGNGKAKKNKKLQSNNNNKNNEDSEKHKRHITAYKYSKMGKGDLYEAVLINDFSYFISYNSITKKIEVVDKIEENNRIIKPPQNEEYPYTPYEFESVYEIYHYVNFILNNNIDIDYFYNKSKSIISEYNSQEDYKLNLIAADVILSYFQDRFGTTHYNYFLGGNGSGKSSIADTFGAIGYRVVIMTDPTAPNLFRLLGIVEPAQCTMILEEAERIDKSEDLMSILKTGYSFNGRVPRINTNANKQEFFFSFCLKIIVSERSLSQSIAKGVNDRTFLHRCIKGNPKYDIKEVLNPTDTGGPKKDKLLQELIDFRKLLLIYRLIHFKDPIPDLDIGIVGRDKELAKPLIQLFHNSEAQNEIIKNLQKILDLRNKKKQDTLESALLPIVVNLISKHGNQFMFSLFWYSLTENIPGKEDEKKPNECHTEDYGTIYRTTITNILRDNFGADTKHTKNGNMLIFDPLVVQKLSKQYNTQITLKIDDITQSDQRTRIDINNKKEGDPDPEKGNNIDNDKKEGSHIGGKEDKEMNRVKAVKAYSEGPPNFSDRNVADIVNYDRYSVRKHVLSDDNSCKEMKNTQKNTISFPPVSSPPSPIHLSSSSSSSITATIAEKEETNILKKSDDDNDIVVDDDELVKLRSLVSPSVYADILSIFTKEENPQIKEFIRYNSKNIKRRSKSDIFTCLSFPKCKYIGDIRFMLKHTCPNFYTQKKKEKGTKIKIKKEY
jgi:hypothetical protein